MLLQFFSNTEIICCGLVINRSKYHYTINFRKDSNKKLYQNSSIRLSTQQNNKNCSAHKIPAVSHNSHIIAHFTQVMLLVIVWLSLSSPCLGDTDSVTLCVSSHRSQLTHTTLSSDSLCRTGPGPGPVVHTPHTECDTR